MRLCSSTSLEYKDSLADQKPAAETLREPQGWSNESACTNKQNCQMSKRHGFRHHSREDYGNKTSHAHRVVIHPQNRPQNRGRTERRSLHLGEPTEQTKTPE
eukprot:GHVQ01006813.1.p3 GENE.GHVQ01006813.1~~GHVQ01006813.1.p3  ORF type:complete len:102 (-),score=14.51 GHVQ01006813.1:658-963(-)